MRLLRSLLPAAASLACAIAIARSAAEPAAPSAPHWALRWEMTETERTFTVRDFKFLSPARAIAAGFTRIERHPKLEPALLVTSDRGAHWSLTEAPAIANSLFFLNDAAGWLVASNGIWFTNEAGRSWRKISNEKGLAAVFFLDPLHGFGGGERSRAVETVDGGKSWTQIAAVPEPAKKATGTLLFGAVAFAGKNDGIFIGFTGDDEETEPAWLDPERARRLRRFSRTSLFVQTHDGGKTWKAREEKLPGQMTSLSLRPNGAGLGLLELDYGSLWPSEVYLFDLPTSHAERLYRQRNRAITSVLAGPRAWLAGTEPIGDVRPNPIPGKVKILHSDDWQNWQEDPVDYRATAHAVFLASPAPDSVWAATDTGTLLQFQP